MDSEAQPHGNFEHVRDPACSYAERTSRHCTSSGSEQRQKRCRVLQQLLRNCNGAAWEEVERVESEEDSAEQTNATAGNVAVPQEHDIGELMRDMDALFGSIFAPPLPPQARGFDDEGAYTSPFGRVFRFREPQEGRQRRPQQQQQEGQERNGPHTPPPHWDQQSVQQLARWKMYRSEAL